MVAASEKTDTTAMAALMCEQIMAVGCGVVTTVSCGGRRRCSESIDGLESKALGRYWQED